MDNTFEPPIWCWCLQCNCFTLMVGGVTAGTTISGLIRQKVCINIICCTNGYTFLLFLLVLLWYWRLLIICFKSKPEKLFYGRNLAVLQILPSSASSFTILLTPILLITRVRRTVRHKFRFSDFVVVFQPIRLCNTVGIAKPWHFLPPQCQIFLPLCPS